MSKLVKRVIGEAADFGPDEFMGGDEGAGGPEEKREAQTANHIM